MASTVDKWFFGTPSRDFFDGLEVIAPLIPKMHCNELARFCATNRTIRQQCVEAGVFQRCRATFEANGQAMNEFREAVLANDPVRLYEIMNNPDMQGLNFNAPLEFIRNWQRENALIYASRIGHSHLVAILIHDARINVAANDCEAFALACEFGHTEIVQMFLQLPVSRGVSPAAQNNRAIRNASRRGYSDVVQMLLSLEGDRAVDSTVWDNSPLEYACRHGHFAVVQQLLNVPVDRDADDLIHACLAAQRGDHANIVRLFIDLPPNKGVDQQAILFEACENGQFMIVYHMLLSGTINPAFNNNLCISAAHDEGHADIVNLLRRDERVIAAGLPPGIE